jgi:hypothetical protein
MPTQVEEDALRMLELQQLMSDLAQERYLTGHRLMEAHPILKEGGNILVGKISITGRKVKQSDASRWERSNLPKTVTGHLVKLSAKIIEEPNV